MLAINGWDERAKKPRSQAFLEMMQKAEKQWREGEKARDPDLSHHRDDKKAAADKPNAPKVVRNKHYKDVVDARLEVAERNAARAANERLPRPLPGTITTVSVSNKINWVVRAVLSSPAYDKFLIFATWEESAHLSEAFSLAGIKSVYAGVKVDRKARDRAIVEFKLGVPVCILDLKLGSRGLDLTVANRMVFLGPVWNPDVQAQAVKVSGVDATRASADTSVFTVSARRVRPVSTSSSPRARSRRTL
jgi:SNF2 family DNA or RNA helicase